MALLVLGQPWQVLETKRAEYGHHRHRHHVRVPVHPKLSRRTWTFTMPLMLDNGT